MKKLNVIAAVCVMFTLTGCFDEDYSICPPEIEANNVTLNFCLPGEDGSCTFLDNISSVTTAIYDQDGELVRLIETSDEHHRAFKGVKTHLEPGEYRAISWGNTGTNTAHKDLEYHYKPDADALVTFGNINDGVVERGDALYYAPNTVSVSRSNTSRTGMSRLGTGEGNEEGEYIMTVTEKGHEGTLNFRHAHRCVEVYVKNFDDGTGENTPLVQLTDLPQGLFFGGMKPIAGSDRVRARMSSEIVTVGKDGEEGLFAMAHFHSFYFHLGDHEIDVNIINPRTGESVYSAHMHDIVAPETDDPEKDIVLRLLIEFIGIDDVRVTIPEWDSDDVDYGIF